MTDEQFRDLVERLDRSAARDPDGYRRRVLGLAVLGYAYFGAVLLALGVLFLLTLASVVYLKALAVKLAIGLGAFIVLVLKAMWVRLAPPAGRAIGRAEAPALFDSVERLRRALKAPPFHRVLITGEFNAAVAQIPRLGLLGWHRNYLLVGLPLLKSLSVAQLEAVLAHEFGHLSAGHGRLSNWIYRLRASWARLMAALEYRRSWGTFMFRRFFNWYVPYFAAYSFPLARANEYHADGVAAALTSSRALAEALTSVSVVDRYLAERYWPEVYTRADDMPQPGFAPFSGMGERLAAGLEESAARSWLERALAHKTDTSNTHPSLSDRLAAIGQSAHLAVPAEEQSAGALLGGSLAPVTADIDRHWQESIRAAWQQRHREVQEGRARLGELDRIAAAGSRLDLTEALERARLTESFGAGAEAAFEQFRALHARAPEVPIHGLALGARLLARDDESGFRLVEQAIERDDELIVAGAEVLRDYCWRKGRTEEAKAWHSRAAARADLVQAARAEREAIHTSDKFESHGLPETTIAELRGQLAAIPHLGKAYLVRKRVRHLPQHPFYVLGFTVRAWWPPARKRRRPEVQRTILDTVRLPAQTMVLGVEGEYYRFGRKFRFMRGTRII